FPPTRIPPRPGSPPHLRSGSLSFWCLKATPSPFQHSRWMALDGSYFDPHQKGEGLSACVQAFFITHLNDYEESQNTPNGHKLLYGVIWGTSRGWGYEARDDKSLVACFARRYGDCGTVFRICAAAFVVS